MNDFGFMGQSSQLKAGDPILRRLWLRLQYGRIKAAIHLDMVGGNPAVTKSVLHITRTPWSASSFTDDVAEIFARYVIDGSYEGAASGDFSQAVREPNGSKDALWADVTEYERGGIGLDTACLQ